MSSPNHSARHAGTVIDLLILHYTGMPCAQEARARLCDPNSGVSAHYLVYEDGKIQQLVSEDRRAWHAGVSFWKGVEDVNSHAIGIEIANPGRRPFPAVQMAAVTALCHSILSRHPIPAHGVLGHSDVAPTRKEDPGEFFDWAGLAEVGVGLWAPQAQVKTPQPVPDATIIAALAEIGYTPPPSLTATETTAILRAFQRHFLPTQITGQADNPTRQRILEVRDCFARSREKV